MLFATRAAGFDRLEISIDESLQRQSRLEWGPCQRREVRNLIASEGVQVSTMCFSGLRGAPFGSHDPIIRTRSLELMKKAIDLACDLGIRIIQVAGYDVYYEPSDQNTRGWFLENLTKSVDLAATSGILLGFETMETPFMDTVEKALCYVNMLHSPYLGIYPDIGNLKNSSLIHGHDLLTDLRAGAGHIYAAHLKETAPGIYRNLQFGEGHTDYCGTIHALVQMGVRIFTGEFWYLCEPDYKAALISASKFLRSQIENALRGESEC